MGAATLSGAPTAAAGRRIRDRSNAAQPFSALAESVAGVIESIREPSTLHLKGDDAAFEVRIGSDATIWREGLAALSDFRVGEEVVAEGHWVGRRFEATALINMYRLVEAAVLASEGQTLRTSEGTIRFVASTRLHRGEDLRPVATAEFAAGEPIRALGRIDVETGELIALRVY